MLQAGFLSKASVSLVSVVQWWLATSCGRPNMLTLFDRAAADILAGWGLTVDPVDFNIMKASVPCPPNTYGERRCSC